MIWNKICALFISVTMLVNLFIGLPPFNPGKEQDMETMNQMLEYLAPKKLDAVDTQTSNLRRPISPEQPMWIIHIDSWNYADPAKIIDLIPEDILPYVVFNISLSINWDDKSKEWLRVHDGYETAKSWLRTCAEKGVWTMIQPASGGPSHFPDYYGDEDLENTIFGEFFEYPNFLGYNYCEQFWGFESADFKISADNRYRHFAKLLELCNKHGGYLDVSWCANQWSPKISPLGMLKRIPEWEEACRKYSQNYILEEKYTQLSYINDVESVVLGSYISGHSGYYGIRYDDSGWSDSTWDGVDGENVPKDQYRVATGLPIHFERLAFNGLTVIDGPELVWKDDFNETSVITDSEGYQARNWKMLDQFQNDMIDMFRKVLDGTVRISSRQEVIDRTKVAVIQDVTKSDKPGGLHPSREDDLYSSYPTLFEGLYRMEDDGNLAYNHNPFRCTGRYPTIPTVYSLSDDLAKSIEVKINQSEIPTRWKSIEDKQSEFNALFPEESWGNFFAGRRENLWVTYNPNKDGRTAGGYFIPKYNTCKQVEVAYSEYGTGIIKEFSDHMDIYLNNFDEKDPTTLKTNTIKIYGASSAPTYTIKHRGVNQLRSDVTENWSNGVYTLTVRHNGPVDIRLNCAGSETDRLTSYKEATYEPPAFPQEYTGPQQFEAEFFDVKNMDKNYGIVTNGCKTGVTGFWGQGYLKFGNNAGTSVKDTVTSKAAGTKTMTLRYSTKAAADISQVDLYVNGAKVDTLTFTKGESLSDWKTIDKQVTLKEGDNKVELKATGAIDGDLYFDNFVIS